MSSGADTQTHTHTHIDTHTQTDTHTHTYTHTYTDTHTDAQTKAISRNQAARVWFKNYKLNNNNYKLKNSLAWKQCFLILITFYFRSQIPFTCSCLSEKFGVFPNKFKGDMNDSFKHVLTLFYHAYLSVWNNLLLCTLISTPYHVVKKKNIIKNTKERKKMKFQPKHPLV